MRKKKVFGFALLFVLVGAVVVAGCIGGEKTTTQSPTETSKPQTETAQQTEKTEETKTEQPKYGGTLIYGIRQEPDTLDPWKTVMSASDLVMNYILDPLVVLDYNLTPQPLLAESWNVSEDGLEWTFKLKKGIKFHDGTPFNADAVVFTFKHILEGNSGWSLEPVKDVVKVDDYTVKFIMERPFPMFLYVISDGGYYGIVSPTAYEKYKDKWGIEVLVGTGPFKLAEWKRGQEIILVRNEDYHHGPDFLENRGPPYLEKIIFRIIPESVTLIGALQSGDVDFATDIPSEFIEKLKKDLNIQFYMKPSYGTRFLIFNLQRELFQDKRIRYAIGYAINREALTNIAWQGAAYPTCAAVPQVAIGYQEPSPDKCIKYNPEKAKQLLAEAGWKDSDGDGIVEKDGKKFEVTLLIISNSEYKKAGVIIQDNLKEIGIKVNIEMLEVGTAIEKAQKGDFDMFLVGYGWPYADGFLKLLAHSSAKGVSNIAFYENPKFDELLAKAESTTSFDEYKKYIKEAQDVLLEDLPVVPLTTTTSTMAAKIHVKGLDKVNKHPWWDTRVISLEVYEEE